MTLGGKPFVIALEEHYYDPELAATFDGPEGRAPETRRRLDDLGELRIKEMDEAGIDMQVLSHGAPSAADDGRRDRGASGARCQRPAGTRRCAAHPDRFAAFAALPTPDPKAAADELERAVTQLGFKGAMVHGTHQRRVLRRQALLADLRARRRRWTCRSICIRRCRIAR